MAFSGVKEMVAVVVNSIKKVYSYLQTFITVKTFIKTDIYRNSNNFSAFRNTL